MEKDIRSFGISLIITINGLVYKQYELLGETNQIIYILDGIDIDNILNKKIKAHVLNNIMYHILSRYEELRSGKILELDEKYLSNLLYLGNERNYYYRNNLIRGAIKDVTKEGFLLLETSDNKSITCDLKELRFIH